MVIVVVVAAVATGALIAGALLWLQVETERFDDRLVPW